MQKVLITGCNGLLGQTLINRLVSRYEVVGLSRGTNRNLNEASYQYIDIDLLDFSRLRELLSDMNPDYIINTAAMTHVDQCEEPAKHARATVRRGDMRIWPRPSLR